MNNHEIDQLFINGQKEQAISELVKKIDQNIHDVNSILQLSAYLVNEGEIEQAKELLIKSVAQNNKDNNLQYNLATVYYMNGEFAESDGILINLEQNSNVLYQRGLNAFHQNSMQMSLAFAMTATEKDDQNYQAYELLGNTWLALGDFNQARVALAQSIRLKDTPSANFLAGIVEFSTDNQDEATTFFAHTKELDNDYYQTAKTRFNDLLKLSKKKD